MSCCHHLAKKKLRSQSFIFILDFFSLIVERWKLLCCCWRCSSSERKMSQNWSILQFLQQHRKEDASNGENIWRLPGLGYHIGAAQLGFCRRERERESEFSHHNIFPAQSEWGKNHIVENLVGVCERVKDSLRERENSSNTHSAAAAHETTRQLTLHARRSPLSMRRPVRNP